MNWDFAAILKFSKSGTNRRLWDRSVTILMILLTKLSKFCAVFKVGQKPDN